MSKTIQAVKPSAKKGSAVNSMSNNLGNLFTGKKGIVIEAKKAKVIAENVTGEKMKKAKQLSEALIEKMAINLAEKTKRRSLTYNLNALKGSAEKYVSLLGTKYDTQISVDELMATLKTPKTFLAYLSEKQKAQFEAKKLGFSYWLILGLVSKHFKANKGK